MSTIYQQLCPVCFGAGAIEEIGRKAGEFGAKKAFCVYDQGVKAAGIADRVIAVLRKAGVEVDTFDGVLPDAPDTLIDKVGAGIHGKGYDLVVGIGGGSSMDTAKAVSVLADHPLPVARYYASGGAGPISGSGTRLILVPTAAGTGSEVTLMSVVHDTTRHLKDAVLRPADLAIVDPELTMTAPPGVTAASALDALSHAVEAYTSVDSNPKDDLLALYAMELIAKNLETACLNGADLEARTALSFASNIAGIAFSDASVHVGHCAAHELGLMLHLPHGVACALATPVTIEFCAPVLPEKTARIAQALGVCPEENGRDPGRAAADALRALMRRTGIRSLREMGYSREMVLSCAEGAVRNNWFHIKAPRPVDAAVMKTLLADMYDSY